MFTDVLFRCMIVSACVYAVRVQTASKQQMLQRLPQQEAVLQLQEVVRDLSILDESLRSLFNGSAPGQEAQHEQLVYVSPFSSSLSPRKLRRHTDVPPVSGPSLLSAFTPQSVNLWYARVYSVYTLALFRGVSLLSE